MNSVSLILVLVILLLLLSAFFMKMGNQAYGLDIDVKCTIYENDDVDVRIYVLGLKANSLYTAEIAPDKSPTISITGESDSQGTFWAVAKVNNGDENSIFKVTLHEGKNTSGPIIIYGDDREPCHQILTSNRANG
jgi:hypothetical protein